MSGSGSEVSLVSRDSNSTQSNGIKAGTIGLLLLSGVVDAELVDDEPVCDGGSGGLDAALTAIPPLAKALAVCPFLRPRFFGSAGAGKAATEGGAEDSTTSMATGGDK